jgi:CTP synthase
VGREHTLFIHLTLLPYVSAAGELKTKPTQHSVRELMEIGIQPDILICRSEHPISADMKRKIALFTNVDVASVIEARDVETIYEVPLDYARQRLDEQVMAKLGLQAPRPALTEWKALVDRVKTPRNGAVRIAVVGKYVALVDSYKSVKEALIHGGIANDVRVDIDWLSSEDFENGQTADKLADYHGLLIPGGFGVRGVEGMLSAIGWAREKGLPFFGICLGMQTAIIEFARSVCRLPEAHSAEWERDTSDPVICLMDSQRQVTDMGGTMRLGAFTARLAAGSRAAEIYGGQEISERHRHRYEVNNAYRETLTEAGLAMSGLSPDGNLVEMIELPSHPWFVATQAHPELKSRPDQPHPLFASFVAAALRRRGSESPRTHSAEGGRPMAEVAG